MAVVIKNCNCETCQGNISWRYTTYGGQVCNCSCHKTPLHVFQHQKSRDAQIKEHRWISFFTQFNECTNEGFTTKHKFHSFEEFPGYLLAFPSKEMFEKIKNKEWDGIDLIVCGKFGGICNSGNNKCRKMRGLHEK